MSEIVIFIGGIVVGVSVGFLLASMLAIAKDGDEGTD